MLEKRNFKVDEAAKKRHSMLCFSNSYARKILEHALPSMTVAHINEKQRTKETI